MITQSFWHGAQQKQDDTSKHSKHSNMPIQICNHLLSLSNDRIKQHQATDYPTRLIETLTTIRSVNKNDAVSLVGNVSPLKLNNKIVWFARPCTQCVAISNRNNRRLGSTENRQI